ncbi:MAG: DUF4349 domain-containing protein [Clostridia bacterium]|nr:DUF4349 domain-containing protein [Clostridia bacterium]
MNCERYEELIHLYVDHRLNKKETDELLSHMATCKHCQETYEEISALKELLGGMQMKELPKGFKEDLRMKLVETSLESEGTWFEKFKNGAWRAPKMKMAVSIGAVAIAAILVLGNNGLVPSMNQLKQTDYEMAYDEAMEETADFALAEPMMATESMAMNESVAEMPPEGAALKAVRSAGGEMATYGVASVETADVEASMDDGGGGAEVTQQSEADFTGRLIIKTANVSMDVVSYDETSATISRMVEEMGGYISDTSSYYYLYDRYDDTKNKKSGYMSLRIPYQFFDQFVNQMGDLGDVTNFSSSASDITKEYRDTTAEMKNLEVREEKLREIMGRAEAIEDVIEVERELSRVRGEINYYQSMLTNWEDLVQLSTVTINMTEVEELKERVQPVDKDMFTKAKEGFIYTINRMVDSAELFIIWLIAALPVLIPVVVIGGIVLRKIIKRWKK